MALIHELLVKVMSEIKAIGKDKRNAAQGFNYRGSDDVCNNLQPIFAQYGIFCTPELVSQESQFVETRNGGKMEYSKITLKITYYAADGSNVSCIVPGAGTDSGDKAIGKAMTYAHRYALTQTFCIPTKDITDGDEDSHEFVVPKTKPVEIYNGTENQKAIIKKLFDNHKVPRELMIKANDLIMSRPMNDAEGIIKNFMNNKYG